MKTDNANQRASKVVGHDGDRDKEVEGIEGRGRKRFFPEIDRGSRSSALLHRKFPLSDG